MKIVVQVREREMNVQVGTGQQPLRWLALSTVQRYADMTGLFHDELEPIYIVSSSTGRPFTDPYARVKDVLADGDRVRVLVTGEESVLHQQRHAMKEIPCDEARVMRPYDYCDLTAFTGALERILVSPEFDKYVGWSASMMSLVIPDSEAFAREVMPNVMPYTNVDTFARNLTKCGFTLSYPPPGESHLPKYEGDRRLEFVHGFDVPDDVSPDDSKKTVMALALSHLKGIREGSTADDDRGATAKQQSSVAAQRIAKGIESDNQLAEVLRVVNDGEAFSSFFRVDLGMAKLLPPEGSGRHEITAVCRALLSHHATSVMAAYRRCLTQHSASVTMSAAEFVAGCREMGMMDDAMLDSKDAEMSFLESSQSRGASENGPLKNMSACDFIGALFHVASRKFVASGWPLSRSFRELLVKYVVPYASAVRDTDYGSIGWMLAVVPRPDVKRALLEVSQQMRDAYYTAAAPAITPTFDKLKVALAKSRLVGLVEGHPAMAKRAFLLATAVEPMSADKGDHTSVSQDAFRNMMLLMSHFVAIALQHATKTPAPAMVPLCSAVSAAVKGGTGEDEESCIAPSIRGYIDATTEDMNRVSVKGRRHK